MQNNIIKFLSSDDKNPVLKGILSGLGFKTSIQKELDKFFIYREQVLTNDNNNDIKIYFSNVAEYITTGIKQYEQKEEQIRGRLSTKQ